VHSYKKEILHRRRGCINPRKRFSARKPVDKIFVDFFFINWKKINKLVDNFSGTQKKINKTVRLFT